MNRNNWILMAFFLYIVSILAFSLIYFRLYKGNQGNFVFARNISRSRSEEFSAAADDSVQSYEYELAAIDEIIKRLESNSDAFEKKASLCDKIGLFDSPKALSIADISDGRVLELRTVTQHTPHGGSGTVLALRLIDKRGTAIWDHPIAGASTHDPKTREDYLDILLKARNDTEKRLALLKKKVSTLPNEYPDVWGYLDFLYFSTITQTTVGYGDILPNSTAVRGVVIAQIVVGYSILVVFINFIFSN